MGICGCSFVFMSGALSCVCRTNGLAECTSTASCVCVLVTLPIWYHESRLSKSPKCVLAYVCNFSWNSLRIVGNEKRMHHVSLSSSLSFEQMPHSSHIAWTNCAETGCAYWMLQNVACSEAKNYIRLKSFNNKGWYKMEIYYFYSTLLFFFLSFLILRRACRKFRIMGY